MKAQASPPTTEKRVRQLVALPFWLLSIGLAVYGYVRRDYSLYSFGLMMTVLQMAMGLYEHWLRSHGPQPTGLQRFLVTVQAFGLAVVIYLVAMLGSWMLFADWFPELQKKTQ